MGTEKQIQKYLDGVVERRYEMHTEGLLAEPIDKHIQKSIDSVLHAVQSIMNNTAPSKTQS